MPACGQKNIFRIKKRETLKNIIQSYNEIEKYKEVNSELVKNILDEAAKINQNIHTLAYKPSRHNERNTWLEKRVQFEGYNIKFTTLEVLKLIEKSTLNLNSNVILFDTDG